MTLNLSPLGNVFGYQNADPQARALVRGKLHAYSGLAITQLGSWLVAVEPLPGPAISLEFGETSGCASVWAEGGGRSLSERTCLAVTALSEPGRLAQLPGDFGGLVINGDEAVIVRSCGGLVPWLLMQQPGYTVVSTRVAWFARFLPTAPEPDLLAHVTFTDGITLPNRRSPWKGATCLQSGTAVVLRPGSTAKTIRYWNLLDRVPARSSSASHVEEVAVEFRSELIRRLKGELADDGSNLLSVSGGVDSSCLAGLAHGPAQRSFHAFSFCGSDDDPHTKEFKQFVEVVLDATRPSSHSFFQYTDQQRISLPAKGLRVGCPVAHPALIELPALVAKSQISVYFGGEFADDLLAGPFLIWTDWFHQLDTRSFLRSLGAPARPITRKGLARLWVHEVWRRKSCNADEYVPVSDLAPIIAPELRAEHAEWKRRFVSEMPTVREPYAHLALACEQDGWLLQNWEVTSELGIRRSVPFVGRRVFELATSLHPADHALPPKRLLRLACASDVAAENLWRVDKGSTVPFSPVEVSIPLLVRPALDRDLNLRFGDGGANRLTPEDAGTVSVLSASLQPVSPGRSVFGNEKSRFLP